MSHSVIDEGGNREKLISNTVKLIGKSKNNLKFFEAVYSKKNMIKTQKEIMDFSGFKSEKDVVNSGKKFVTAKIVEPIKNNGKTTYQKVPIYTDIKNEIIRKAKKGINGNGVKEKQDEKEIKIRVDVRSKTYKAKETFIEDIDSFSKAHKIKKVKSKRRPEEEIKQLIKKISGEEGKFTDWGGEINDISTTRLKIKGKRINCSFALKGKGTPTPLTQKKMGKHGDQISRLFRSPSQAFFVQFDAQIDQNIIELMKNLAENKAQEDKRTIYYGTIDGVDTERLFQAYNRKH